MSSCLMSSADRFQSLWALDYVPVPVYQVILVCLVYGLAGCRPSESCLVQFWLHSGLEDDLRI